MPLRNRVSPYGDLIETPARGRLMGNRGVLHDHSATIRRSWQLKRWIFCRLEFKGRHRQVMTPGRYTELFFLDEATALAAGHRPCAECLRDRYETYRKAFSSSSILDSLAQPIPAGTIDSRLHEERLDPSQREDASLARLADLPDGVMVEVPGRAGTAMLLWNACLLPWTPSGYQSPIELPAAGTVRVLTPASSVNAVRNGYVPLIHESVLRRES